MAKVSMTFRIDAELAKRLKEHVAKSGGNLTQAEVIESALADRFAVKDGTKLLAKVNENQQTAVTLVKEQSQSLAKFQSEVGQVIVGYKKQIQTDVARLEQTTQQELRGTTAGLRTMESQMAQAIGTLRQIEHAVEQHAKARLEAWQYVTIGTLMGFAILGLVSSVWWTMRWAGAI
jgi:predicted transcriptional regulator